MTAEETVRAWKDPDLRRAGRFAGHPAGEIALDLAGGTAATHEVITWITCSMTCDYTCLPTMYGTCAIGTQGCCAA
jgi:hypothetical protein